MQARHVRDKVTTHVGGIIGPAGIRPPDAAPCFGTASSRHGVAHGIDHARGRDRRYASGVNVMPDSAELTTQQAAEFLNVSRPYLIKLLESGQIPFRRVGTHRRIRFRDLRLYKSQDDLERRQADELTQLSQELGLY
jgi:excisionase family DNA binding protein